MAILYRITDTFLTFYLVKGISVYSTNLLNPTRGQMVENCMFVLAVVTVIFVLVHQFLDWKKEKPIDTSYKNKPEKDV